MPRGRTQSGLDAWTGLLPDPLYKDLKNPALAASNVLSHPIPPEANESSTGILHIEDATPTMDEDPTPAMGFVSALPRISYERRLSSAGVELPGS